MADHPYIGPAFAEDVKPGWLIGQMLIGYGELEYEVASLLGAAYHPHLALRAMFRVRGETARLEVADALLFKKCAEAKISDKYRVAMDAVRYCKGVRNQYAHCHWNLQGDDLWFYNMETAAEGNTDEIDFTFEHVSIKLLLEQLAFFNYARYCLIHLQNQFGFFHGLGTASPQPWPETLSPPKKSNLKRKLSDLMKQSGQHNPR